MINRVVGVYFSPTEGTAKIIRRIASEIAQRMNDECIEEMQVSYIDFLHEPPADDQNYSRDDIVVVGMPAYNGRIPLPCIKMIQKMHGDGTLAVSVIDYGNSSYGDSLYELYSFLEDQGFEVVSAGAFVSEHVMFRRIAEDRPDMEDFKKIIEFSELTAKKLHRFCGTVIDELRSKPAPLDVRGSMPTKSPFRIPFHPTPNSKCTQCGECAKICPVGAIDPEDPSKVDGKKCIACTACISACPEGARGFHGPMCAASRIAFEKLYSKRKDPEWFL
jgi:ferredoxin